MVAFVAGQLSNTQRCAFSDHIDVCERCRRVVSALAAAECVTPSATPSEPVALRSEAGLRSGQMLGRFSLTRVLGHGSMGEVWAAHDQELDREVALKLLALRPGTLGSEATVRLRREAQAMARLNHPNVVAIYELGAAEDRVFCAMELVDGVTLRRWLETPRSWREVVRMASAVARGVAAAHAVELIHRDIKPENVLIASGGRTLVSDFGLAKLGDLGTEADEADGGDDAGNTAGNWPIATLTATGAMIGTPAYMSPEQLAGDRADARSDQFSYCVTIHEALFGARPFAGSTVKELAQSIRRGPPRVPRVGGVPKGIVRCLARGLAVDPAARWPSMSVLVDELERAARRPRQRRIAALACGVGVLASVTGLVIARQPTPLDAAMTAAKQRIATAWNPVRAAVLRARFLGTGEPLSSERAATTTKLLDEYRTEWMTQRLDAWSATHVRGEQTAETLERRLACFDQLADAMDGLVDLLLAPGVRDVQEAPQSVYRLDRVATCGNVARLLARPIAQNTPAGILAEWQLHQLEAALRASRYPEAYERARLLVDTVMHLGQPGILARARSDLGRAQAASGHFIDAEATLRLALEEAAAVRDHSLVADCWLQLLKVIAYELHQPDVATTLEPAVRAAVAQAGNDADQLAGLARTLGMVAVARGNHPAAQVHFLEARDRRVAARGPNDPSVATDEFNLAGSLIKLGRLDEATAHFERAITIIRSTVGEHHPVIAQVEHNLASIAYERRDWNTAERRLRAAVAMNIATRGVDHPGTATDRIDLAEVLREQKHFADARAELELARAILAQSLPENHPTRTTLDSYFAEIERDEGHWDKALRLARQVVDATRHSEIPAADRRLPVFVLASIVAHGAPRKALPIYDEALRLLLTENGHPVQSEVEILRAFADAAVKANRPEAALQWFDRMPEGAKQLTDVRRELERASASRR